MNNTYNRQRVARFFQVIGLMAVLLLERIVGLPIVFLGITLQTIDLSNTIIKRMVIVTAVIVLALVYQFSFLASFAVIGVGIASGFVLRQLSSSKTATLLVSTVVMVGALAFYLDIIITPRVLLYSMVSLLVLVGLVRTTRNYT